MPCMFNPGYIGPNPPCCDPDCKDAKNCNNPECGPCPGPHAPCGACSPPVENPESDCKECLKGLKANKEKACLAQEK